MLPQSVAQLRGVLEMTPLFQGEISPARAGALKGFVCVMTGKPDLPSIPHDLIAETLKRGRIAKNDLHTLRVNFGSLVDGKMRRPGTPLKEMDKSCFNVTLLRVMHLPWNAQIAGAFLAFAGQEDEKIPTAAAGFFPDYDSFRTQSIAWPPGYSRQPRLNQHNNFYVHFCRYDRNHHRMKPAYCRFLREEPEMERDLTEKITSGVHPHKGVSESLPAFEPELYEAYKKMASYVEEVRAKEAPEWPWRALIT